MKTNPFARSILKVRVISLLLATAAMAGTGFTLGDALPRKAKPASMIHHAPNASVADVFNFAIP